MGFTDTITLHTEHGDLLGTLFEGSSGENCFVVYKVPTTQVPIVRIHSSCLFSESFHANDCDCSRQLNAFLQLIASRGGYLFYLFQEGRGTGLKNKIQAIRLQEVQHLNTAQAFLELGKVPDPRTYQAAFEAMMSLELPSKIILATNNPDKVERLSDAGFDVVERLQLKYDTNEKIDKYLNMKVECLNHHAKK